MQKLNVSVLGCGRWGSFLAWYADGLGHSVASYGPENSKEYQTLLTTRTNEYVQYTDGIELTSDLAYAVGRADVIIISVPSQAFGGFINKIAACGIENKDIILCMKGIEIETGKRLSQIAIDNGVKQNNVAVWVGPGHIQEFTKKNPNCMVIDGYDRGIVHRTVQRFKSPLIRFYYGEDIIGAEIGAAAKNVMGIVAGMLDGLGLTTLKGALMARGAREVSRLIAAMGGDGQTAYGLSHLGDYETTLFSPHSHNRSFGEAFSRGQSFEKLAEGVYTAKAMVELCKKHNVEMPITQAVYSIIYEKVPIENTLQQLFGRELKSEFYD